MGSADTPRTFAPVVDQHATWLALNPVQRCIKGCAYCFLAQRGQIRVSPAVVADTLTRGDAAAGLAAVRPAAAGRALHLDRRHGHRPHPPAPARAVLDRHDRMPATSGGQKLGRTHVGMASIQRQGAM
jgi:hypothetical protein